MSIADLKSKGLVEGARNDVGVVALLARDCNQVLPYFKSDGPWIVALHEMAVRDRRR